MARDRVVGFLPTLHHNGHGILDYVTGGGGTETVSKGREDESTSLGQDGTILTKLQGGDHGTRNGHQGLAGGKLTYHRQGPQRNNKSLATGGTRMLAVPGNLVGRGTGEMKMRLKEEKGKRWPDLKRK